MSEIRTQAFVLRRTNYGEADRILNLLTPEGKIAVIAKGVRKEKSKLAGNIEMFCRSDVTIHKSTTDPERLGILTSARIVQAYPRVLADLAALEFASQVLQQVDRAAENVNHVVFFDMVVQVLEGIEHQLDSRLIEIWFRFNLAQANGEPPNFYRDVNGDQLNSDQTYFWDATEQALRPDPRGNIASREIKLARLLLTNTLKMAARVQDIDQILPALML